MSTLRMTSDLRRQLILGAAKRCFARNGFAGTTTKSVAAAAAISEGLLFKHFPSMAALTRLPVIPCLDYGNPAGLERQLCQFILRGIGLNEAAIASHLDRALSPIPGPSVAAESA